MGGIINGMVLAMKKSGQMEQIIDDDADQQY